MRDSTTDPLYLAPTPAIHHVLPSFSRKKNVVDRLHQSTTKGWSSFRTAIWSFYLQVTAESRGEVAADEGDI